MISDDRLAELIVSMQGNVRIGSVADHVGDALMELRDRRRAVLAPPQEPAPSAPAAAMPEIIVSGPVACGKSYVMELIYKALRDAGLHPYSDELAHERRMVDEQPLPPAKVWKLRESIAAPQPDEAVALLREVVRRYDDYRGKGMLPAPGEYQMVVGAIERIRAFLTVETANAAALEEVMKAANAEAARTGETK